MLETLKPLVWMIAGGGVTLMLLLSLIAGQYFLKSHGKAPPHAEGVQVTAVEDPINTAWLLEGKPKLQTTYFFKAADGKVFAGLWEANGPAKFEWHYGMDETVLVLEGSAKLTYQGKVSEIGAGSSVYFKAGEVVLWEVPERIKKTWVLYEPGRVARRLRALLD